jgi:hypothetical protein
MARYGGATVETKVTINPSKFSQRMKNSLIEGTKTRLFIGGYDAGRLAHAMSDLAEVPSPVRINSWYLAVPAFAPGITRKKWAEVVAAMQLMMRVSNMDNRSGNKRYGYESTVSVFDNVLAKASNPEITDWKPESLHISPFVEGFAKPSEAYKAMAQIFKKQFETDYTREDAEKMRVLLNTDKDHTFTFAR